MRIRTTLYIALLLSVASTTGLGQTRRSKSYIPPATLLTIVKAEDERRWDGDVRLLLASSNAAVRGRAALAAGRIGNEDALAELSNMVAQDKDANVRAWAAFAIGEVESEKGANALLQRLQSTSETSEVRARAIEGLGKIAGAMPRDQQPRITEIATAVVNALKTETESTTPNRDVLCWE